jgi:hypothetical protein
LEKAEATKKPHLTKDELLDRAYKGFITKACVQKTGNMFVK